MGRAVGQDYLASRWLPALQAAGLDRFEALWTLDAGWVEEPNRRRGGWSGVSRCQMELPEGGRVGVYIKRQQDHVCRTLAHPLRGMPTLRREFRNLLRYRAYGLPTVEPLFYAERLVEGHRRAILVTRELAGYASLQRCLGYWDRFGWPQAGVRRDIIRSLAAVTRQLHRHHLQHNCFYPGHLFIGEERGRMVICILDLEKTKWRLSTRRAMLRDLDTLNRRSPEWSRTDRLRFLLDYLGRSRADDRVRRVWKRLAARAGRHAGE